MDDDEIARRLNVLEAAVDEAQALGLAACASLAAMDHVANVPAAQVNQQLQELSSGLARAEQVIVRARAIIAEIRRLAARQGRQGRYEE